MILDRIQGKVRVALLSIVVLAPMSLVFSRQTGPLVAFDALAATYGFAVVAAQPDFSVTTAHATLRGGQPSKESIEDCYRWFSQEVPLYPRELVKRIGLKRIVLCTGLRSNEEKRGAIPEFEEVALYLDIESCKGAYAVSVFHHELFHLIDWRDDNIVYSDVKWEELNRPDFKYGNGGRSMRDSQAAQLTREVPGFLNRFSTSGVEEDKAEVFARMIIDPQYVEEVSKDDAILGAKVGLMKARLQGFCHAIDAEFWNNVRNYRVPKAPSK